MSISKSLSNLNIIDNQNYNDNNENNDFQIDFESINTLGAQYETNESVFIDETDFVNIQENVEEYSDQIQQEILRTNDYSKESTINILPIAQCVDQIEDTDTNCFDDSCEYESNFIPAKDFSIRLGTNEIPRFSCSSHKNNIAVRMAIKKSPSLSKMLVTLSRYAASVRVSILKSPNFIKKKVRLQVENKTRWSSSFLMLESFYRAHQASAFLEDNPCPVTYERIQKYLLILLPAYQFNLIMQKDKSSIADVLPSLEIMLSKWARMELYGEYNVLRNHLIAAFKHKFSYEINSSIYSVAAILNISKLNIWYNRKDCLYIRKSAHSNLLKVRELFEKKKETLKENNYQNSNIANANDTDSNDSLAAFLKDDDYQSNSELESEIKSTTTENEKIEFYQVIEDKEFGTSSTKSFWLKILLLVVIIVMALFRKIFSFFINIHINHNGELKYKLIYYKLIRKFFKFKNLDR